MAILLSHISALQLVRHNPQLILDADIAEMPSKTEACIPADEALQTALDYRLSLPIRVIVRGRNQRYRSTNVRRFCRAHIPPYECVLKITDDLLVCSPRYLPTMLTETLAFPRLVMLLCEFCGTYSVDEHEEYGFNQHNAFTTVNKWKTFCTKNVGHQGIPALAYALDFAFDNSASPRETKVAILLTFPRRLGGYGLPKPLLNYPIKVKKSNGETTTLRCDLYWPKEKLAIEYESDMTHTGAKRITEDSERRDMLASRGIRLLTITNSQLKSAVEMHALARTIRRILGIRSTRQTSEWAALNQSLRTDLGLAAATAATPDATPDATAATADATAATPAPDSATAAETAEPAEEIPSLATPSPPETTDP